MLLWYWLKRGITTNDSDDRYYGAIDDGAEALARKTVAHRKKLEAEKVSKQLAEKLEELQRETEIITHKQTPLQVRSKSRKVTPNFSVLNKKTEIANENVAVEVDNYFDMDLVMAIIEMGDE